MAWAFRDATFRDAHFFVAATDLQSGRALHGHEIPGAREIWEDLGPEAFRLMVDAYIVAPPSLTGQTRVRAITQEVEHLTVSDLGVPLSRGLGTQTVGYTSRDDRIDYVYGARDKLLKALEQPTPGVLIHPTFGAVSVRAERWTVHEEKGEQFFLRVSIDFVRDDDANLTAAFPASDAAGSAKALSTAIEAAGRDRVVSDLATGGVAQTAIEATAEELRKLGGALRKLDVFKSAGVAASQLAHAAVGLIQDAKSLATAPADLVSTVVTAIRDVERAASDALGALAAYEALLQLVPSVVGSPAEDKNAQIVSGLIRGAAAGGALRACASVEWESYQQAIAERDRLRALLESLLAFASDSEYDNLLAIMAWLVDFVPPEDENLPRVSSYTPPATTTVLVIAWRLYADRSRDAEIIARNRIRNPNFVTGGVALEVLVNAEPS